MTWILPENIHTLLCYKTLVPQLMTDDITDFHTSKKCISMENDVLLLLFKRNIVVSTKNRYNAFNKRMENSSCVFFFFFF